MKKLLVISQWIPGIGIFIAPLCMNHKYSVIENYFWVSSIWQGVSTIFVILLILRLLFGVI